MAATPSPSTASDKPASPAAAPQFVSSGSGASLWRMLYFNLWLVLALLASLIAWPRDTGALSVVACIAWAAGLGVVMAAACFLRILIHDALVGLVLRDRVGLGLLVVGIGITPALLPRAEMIPDGLFWMTITLAFVAVKPTLARQCLGLALVTAFFALGRLAPTLGEWVLAGAFGLAWLAALGAVHFTFMGDMHGLGGLWPVRRVWRNSLLLALPALAVATGLAWLWPAAGLVAPAAPRNAPPTSTHPQPLLQRIGQLDLLALLYHGTIVVVATAFLFVLMFYLRRWMLRHMRGGQTQQLLPGQLSHLTYQAVPTPPEAPTVGGRRGQIIGLWNKWADGIAREKEGRGSGETAEAFALRIARESPPNAPPADLTRLLERAHYGAEEPTAEELVRMRQLVQEEISRQSLRLGLPEENLD